MGLTAEQLATRSTGLGGSDAAVACGVSRWKTPYQLYLEKRGEVPPIEQTEPMRWGHLLEPLVRQEYSERTGRVVRLPSDTLRHPEHTFSPSYTSVSISPNASLIGVSMAVI